MAASVEFVKVKCEIEVKHGYPEDLETETTEEYKNEEYSSLGETENLLPIKTDLDLSSVAEPPGIDEANISFESPIEEENEYILSDNSFIPETPVENHPQASIETQPGEVPKINFGLFRTQFNKKVELLDCPETSVVLTNCSYPCTFYGENFKCLNDRSKHLVNCAARNSTQERNMDASPFLCVFCGLKFKLISQRTKHLSFCTAAISSLEEKANDDDGDSSYTCVYCGIKYKIREAFVEHLSVCDSQKCSAGVNFKRVDKPGDEKGKNSLKNKLLSDSVKPTSRLASRYVYVCHKCHAEFDEKCQLQQHFRTQHCVKNLTDSSKAESLSKIPPNPAESTRPFVCPHCRSQFTFHWNLQAHLSTCTAPVSSKQENLMTQEASLPFTYGGLQKDLLKRSLHSSAYPFACKHCSVKFKLVKDLTNHLSVCSETKSSTGENSKVKSADTYRPFICISCGMKCKTRKELHNHTCNFEKCSMENNSKTIKVSGPELVIKTEGNSIDDPFHNTTELSEDTKEVFFCHHCNAVFTQKLELRKHFETHRQMDDFRHICGECGMKFKQLHNLERHEAMHTKPFMCRRCSVSFDSLSLLEEHTATHPPAPADSSSETSSLDPDNFPVKHNQVYECGLCHIVFPEANHLEQHVSTHSDEYFECSHCPAKLRSKSLLKRHEQQHGVRKFLTCNQCPATFKLPCNLEAHLRVHSIDLPAEKLGCEWCSITFTSTVDLAKHLIVHTREKDYVCEDCGKGFSQPSKLEAHQLKHMDGKPFSCPHCPKRFRVLQGLQGHVRKHTSKQPYACEFCSSTFTELSTLRAHTRTHTQEKPFPCSYCPVRFTQNSALLAHLKIHPGKEPYVCELCSKAFKQLSHLRKHKVLHRDENCFSCDQCSATFRSERNVKAHKLKHKKKYEEKLYTCAICEEKFSRKTTLQVHLRTHTEPQMLHCDKCSATFDRQSHLERHMRVHTKEKPFKCTHCGMRFSQKCVLINHERIHTGEKPYTCSHCQLKFSWRDTWLSHQKIHIGKNLFSCEICSVPYNNKTTLQKHLKTHRRENSFNESLFEKIIVKKEQD